MRAKLLFSAASVAGFMVLSVAALASIPGNEPAKVIPNSEIVAVAVPGPASRDGAQIEAEFNRIACTESEEYLLARIAMAEAESEDRGTAETVCGAYGHILTGLLGCKCKAGHVTAGDELYGEYVWHCIGGAGNKFLGIVWGCGP